MLGLRVGISRRVAFFVSSNEKRDLISIVLAGLGCVLFTGLLLTGVAFVGGKYLALSVFHEPELYPVVLILSSGLIIYLWSQILVASLTGLRHMQDVFWVYLIEGSMLVVLFVALFLAGLRLPQVAFAYLIGTIGGFAAAAVSAKSKSLLSIPNDLSKEAIFGQAKQLVVYSLPVWLSQLFLIIRRQADLLVLAAFLPADQVGLYASASLLASTALVPLFGLENIYLPTASHLIVQERYDELKDSYQLVARWLFLWGGLVFIIILLLSEHFLNLFFGEHYRGGSLILMLLMAGVWFNTMTATQGSLNYAFGNTGIVLFGTVVGLVSGLLAAVLLIPRFGTIGAAISSLISLILSEGIMVGMLFIKHRIQPVQRTHLSVLFSVIAIYIIARTVQHYFVFSGSLFAFLMFCSGVLVLYFSSVLILGRAYISDIAKLR